MDFTIVGRLRARAAPLPSASAHLFRAAGSICESQQTPPRGPFARQISGLIGEIKSAREVVDEMVAQCIF
jgi:hypothetical protein